MSTQDDAAIAEARKTGVVVGLEIRR